jgi:putative transposase
MGIARSTYYDRPQAQIDDTALVAAIAGICEEFKAYMAGVVSKRRCASRG